VIVVGFTCDFNQLKFLFGSRQSDMRVCVRRRLSTFTTPAAAAVAVAVAVAVTLFFALSRRAASSFSEALRVHFVESWQLRSASLRLQV